MKNGAWFPYMLVAILLTSVGANIYLIIRATQDPSFAVEPDYYEKAVRWDEIQEQRRRSEALGWDVELDASRERLAIRLQDAAGVPIEGAKVEVMAFHNARAEDRIVATMRPDGEGRYVLDRSFDRPGIWEFRLAARVDEDEFRHVSKEEL